MSIHDAVDPSLESLYTELGGELERIVSANVRASSGLLEEACQAAWAGLVGQRARIVPGTELCWLAITATREALRLSRLERRELSLEQECEQQGELIELSFGPGPDDVVELRERLADVRVLPPRQRQMVLLQGFGYRYEEIAAATGSSVRTVERQLLRARRRLAG